MNPEREHIGEIEPQKDPFRDDQLKKIDDFIASNSELQAVIQSIRNEFFSDPALSNFIDKWNEAHKEWVGAYVEKAFEGANGRNLKIRMDHAGNVQLGAHYMENQKKRGPDG